VQAGNLTTGHTQSCGCFVKEETSARFTSHGQYGSLSYKSWADMIQRCENPKKFGYEYYGGRGITVCERWHNFEDFYADMGDKPTPKHTLERNRVDGNYDPNNCVWATQKEQQNNKRNNRIIEFRGQAKTLHQWADDFGINYGTLWSRLEVLRWPLEKSLTQSAGPQGHKPKGGKLDAKY
jgi:hypothetical protein